MSNVAHFLACWICVCILCTTTDDCFVFARVIYCRLEARSSSYSNNSLVPLSVYLFMRVVLCCLAVIEIMLLCFNLFVYISVCILFFGRIFLVIASFRLVRGGNNPFSLARLNTCRKSAGALCTVYCRCCCCFLS